ncbi:hypothetical protein QCE73_00020 [Caballeronia sp. LZ029]|uniref:hypothetical protein n=1 Tax=Caballeronia sp. LZ029 TaxID=3038564 RepID=UPI00285B9A47|nr:hypothetical protein [Caballeronia sp. LZ029]MDR5741533.1 hypothetical protein [Caballeronia sp. LZ029]
MTTTTIKTVSASAAIHLLNSELGSEDHNSSDFLADNIRGRQNIAGLQLLPVALRRYRGAFRPVYDLEAVHAFIKDVRAIVPSAVPAPVKVMALAIDQTKHWRMNKFDPSGVPIAMHP